MRIEILWIFIISFFFEGDCFGAWVERFFTFFFFSLSLLFHWVGLGLWGELDWVAAWLFLGWVWAFCFYYIKLNGSS
jgi:hypothetical protein